MHLKPPTLNETAALLNLLEDDDQQVRAAVVDRLEHTNGDLSHQIAALGLDLAPGDRWRLSGILSAARRHALEQEWSVPSSGLWEPSDDWESFEYLIGLISDFLHDGIELRPSVVDQLDWLAGEFDARGVSSVNALRVELFDEWRFRGNEDTYYSPKNSDLSWVLSSGQGNPLSLSLIFILIAHRLGFHVEGCNVPGHFLARVGIDGQDYLVDCFYRGELMRVQDVIAGQGGQNADLINCLKNKVSFAEILRRILHNLVFSFSRAHDKESALLLNRLASSLLP